VTGHPGLATHEPTVRLSATKSIALQWFSLSRWASATHEQDTRAGCPGRVKTARVSLALVTQSLTYLFIVIAAQAEQCYMTSSSSSCSDVIMQQHQQQMMMMVTYQDGGLGVGVGGCGAYSVLPPVGARLRHDAATAATPGEHAAAANFTHPFSITNIMSARQQQQLLHTAEEFPDDVKANNGEVDFPGELPQNDVIIANYSSYHQTPYRLMPPPPCVLQAPPTYSGHVTDRKPTPAAPAPTPSLNGGLGYDAAVAAAHYGTVPTVADPPVTSRWRLWSIQWRHRYSSSSVSLYDQLLSRPPKHLRGRVEIVCWGRLMHDPNSRTNVVYLAKI